ncbi:hypothetical protein ACHAXA_000215 [Cyclostephanos tholiformis]|uniref:BRCT domain-containing protein n=1 Tax=Cyclostephanos tholiformis TaxID=382380 RepID=A0ABD3R1L0_9STRA
MGSKYDHWRRNYRLHLRHEAAASSTFSRPSPYEWADRLHVVRTSWVEACLREGRRVPEEDYRLPSPSEDEGDDRGNAMHSKTKSTSAGRRGSGILADKKGASEGRDGAVNVTSSSMARRIAVDEGTMSSPSSKSRPSSGGRRTSERQFSLPEEIVRHAPTLVERYDDCYRKEDENDNSYLRRKLMWSLLREAIRKDDVKDSAQKKMNLIKFSVKPSSDNPDRNLHGQSRKYYVVSNITPDYRLNNQLIELSNLGIDLIPVSSVWIAACTRNDCKYDPEEYPLLFQPQTWPIRLINSFADPTKSLSENEGRNSIKPKRSLLISVTGFVDSSRYGIISMLHEIGAGYTDNLSRKNTHLICKDGSGQKYVKALEWGLRVVSIDWLYHIVRHGCEDESEERFSFVFGAREEPVDEITQTQLSLKRNTINTTFSTNKDERKGTSSSLNDNDDYDKEEVEEMANQSAEKRGKTQRLQPFEINGHITVKGGGWADDATKEKYSSRIRRYLAQVSSPPPPNDLDYCPGQYPSRDEGAYLCGASSNKRLLIAHHRTLDEPVSELITNINESRARHLSGNGNISVPNAHREQITPSSLLLPPPFQEQTGIQDGDEILAMSHLETETQFTTGTILANADIGDMFLNNKIGHGDFSSEEVPPSQANDAESNGESQVIWFAAARG